MFYQIYLVKISVLMFYVVFQSVILKLNAQTTTQNDVVSQKVEQRKQAAIDRQKMLEHLGIQLPELGSEKYDTNKPAGLTQRPGSDKWYDAHRNMYIRSAWGKWSNYDEGKANLFVLPDPLTLNNGNKVTTEKCWYKKRRPEIVAMFENEIYGKIPKYTPKVVFETISTTQSDAFICKKIIGHIDNSAFPAATPGINLRIYYPAEMSGKMPLVVIAIGNYGNTDTLVINKILLNHWACATVETDSVQMDSGAGLKLGIIGLQNKGSNRKPTDWGALSAWAWGLNKSLDYLLTDSNIDASKIMLQGHSRWGKLALWAGALDTRWAAVYSSCSGAGGAALGMRDFAENIDNVADVNLYHWMAGNFLKYGDNWEKMPVDAHQLIALMAPRPIFVAAGTKDTWTDPNGQFMACVAADPVFKLLYKKGLKIYEVPHPDKALIDGTIGFRLHEGGHTDRPDWQFFFEFIKNNIH